MPNNEKIILGGIDEGSRPQIVTILSELVNASSAVVDIDHEAQLGGKRDKPISPLSINYAAEFMANHITAVYLYRTIDSEGMATVKVVCYGLSITADFYPTSYSIIKKASTPANFSTAADLRAALMRVFVSSRKTVFGCAKISAMPSVTQSSLITQIDFIKDLKPKSTTISVVYPSEYSKDTAYVIVKNFTLGNLVFYARYEMSATDLNKALGSSEIYGEITLPETVLDKLISSY